MTVTRMTTASNSNNNSFSYEVELEVSDVRSFILHANDEKSFRSLVRCYLENAASLTHLLAYAKQKSIQSAQIKKANAVAKAKNEALLLENNRASAA